MSQSYVQRLIDHYQSAWNAEGRVRRWQQGPWHDLAAGFCILEIPPTPQRALWTYATCGMSQPTQPSPVELHLFSSSPNELHLELLTAVAHYHHTARHVDLWDTVNFGRPWLPGSACDHGLVSLPYLDGPTLEKMEWEGGLARCLWLVPITRAEVEYKKARGIEALEQRLEDAHFDYAAELRPSVV